jgi:hypothetical protein
MHPNVYLKTFWRTDIRPQVFVAMSFAPTYNRRYAEVFTPAIESLSANGDALRPFRVDISKSGDSILTDIMDGIAHSRLILADLSTIGRDSLSGQSFRNGNVMYEVGIALACRQPHEVLLVRDDSDRFLFDVSTIPHMTIDFDDVRSAREAIGDELQARLRESNYLNDARVQIAIATLTNDEIETLKKMMQPNVVYAGLNRPERLLDKGLVKRVVRGSVRFELTELGRAVAMS